MSRAHKRIRMICLLVLLATLLSCVGISYARYSSTINEELLFEAQALDGSRKIAITSQKGWQRTAGGMTIAFSLSGGGTAASSRHAYLRLTATEALPSDTAVTLTVAGVTYRGVPTAITAAHSLYAKMGAGTEYRFETADGELYWPLTGAGTMTLSVQGASEAALLRLTATEK